MVLQNRIRQPVLPKRPFVNLETRRHWLAYEVVAGSSLAGARRIDRHPRTGPSGSETVDTTAFFLSPLPIRYCAPGRDSCHGSM